MDTYETLNHSPFSGFDANAKFGKPAGLQSDGCDYSSFSRRERESVKPMKYYTQNFFDEQIVQDRGIFFRDGIDVPACAVGASSGLRIGKMTNVNLPQDLPALPLPTAASYAHGQGPVPAEDKIRPGSLRGKNASQPRDTSFYNRSFYIFDTMPCAPNQDATYVVQKSNGYYMGVDTRHMNNTKYKRG